MTIRTRFYKYVTKSAPPAYILIQALERKRQERRFQIIFWKLKKKTQPQGTNKLTATNMQGSFTKSRAEISCTIEEAHAEHPQIIKDCIICYEGLAATTERIVYCPRCAARSRGEAWMAHSECWEQWQQRTCFTCTVFLGPVVGTSPPVGESNTRDAFAWLADELVDVTALSAVLALSCGFFCLFFNLEYGLLLFIRIAILPAHLFVMLLSLQFASEDRAIRVKARNALIYVAKKIKMY